MSGRQHRALSAHGFLDMLQLCLANPDIETYFIICGERHVLRSVVGDWLASESERTDPDLVTEASQITARHLRSKRLSLRNLSACRSIKLAFCSDVAHLRAHALSLSLNDPSASAESSTTTSRLIIVNMLQLHVRTSSWSAQGLNRSLAAVIDAATSSNAQLLICEDVSLPVHQEEPGLRSSSPPVEAEDAADTSAISIWDREVGIIDAHTKTFGHDSRAWTGRRVPVRQVLERWLLFDDEEEQ